MFVQQENNMKKIFGSSLALTVAITALVIIGGCTKHPTQPQPVILPHELTLISPPNGAINVLQHTALFIWHKTSDAYFYGIQIANDSAFTSIDYNSSVSCWPDSSDPDLTLHTQIAFWDNYIGNNKYYWRVLAYDSVGDLIKTSAGWSFTLGWGAISNPVISTPTSIASWLSFNPLTGKGTLPVGFGVDNLDAGRDTIIYTLYLGFYYDSLTQVYTGSKQNYNLAGINSSQNIYYKLTAFNPSFDTVIKAGFFITPSAPTLPAIPVLSLPLNTTGNSSLTPMLAWSDTTASSFHVQIATDSSFSSTSIIENDSALTLNTLTITKSLSDSTKYFWRVNATNILGTSAWSQVWSFTTKPLKVPTLVSPSNGTLNTSVTPTFTWSDTSNPTAYHLQIATDSTFAASVVYDSTFSTILDTIVTWNTYYGMHATSYQYASYTIVLSDSITIKKSLGDSTKYFWRMTAINSGGTSAWSSAWSFTTRPASPWSDLDSGMNNGVNALAVDGSGNLYAGGLFTNAGGTAANYIAKWNGSSWSTLGSGMNAGVNSLVVDSFGNLYAGGLFTNAGGTAANYIAKWNGSSWNALGSGMNAAVNALAVDKSGNLFAGGYFITAGQVAPYYIAKWNGSAWTTLGTGMTDTNGNCSIAALAVDGSGNLYAGGKFTSADGVAASNIAKWNGTSWSALGSGVDSAVTTLAIDDLGNLYVGGQFTSAGGVTANHIAKWNGSAWSTLGNGMNNSVYALTLDSASNLYAGGNFIAAGNVAANNIAKWNGTSWSAIGSGINGNINALKIDKSGKVYAGGQFTLAGGDLAQNIAVLK